MEVSRVEDLFGVSALSFGKCRETKLSILILQWRDFLIDLLDIGNVRLCGRW